MQQAGGLQAGAASAVAAARSLPLARPRLGSQARHSSVSDCASSAVGMARAPRFGRGVAARCCAGVLLLLAIWARAAPVAPVPNLIL